MCIAVAVVLAVVAAIQALDAASNIHAFQPLTNPQAILDAPVQMMRALISAVLAGVAFFAGLACFFWGALLDSRQQMAGILEQLRERQ